MGVLNIAVHPTWAPLGAQRVLQMVENGFFDAEVAFFRALAGFLVQFGIAGDPKVQAKFDESHGGRGGLPDDPQWLPPGPPGREINGVTRFQKGYLSYAGSCFLLLFFSQQSQLSFNPTLCTSLLLLMLTTSNRCGQEFSRYPTDHGANTKQVLGRRIALGSSMGSIGRRVILVCHRQNVHEIRGKGISR
jgi:hypothetical protein